MEARSGGYAPAGGLRARLRTISPSAFRRISYAALGALLVVVVTGAVVRLTASGLGCDNWPRCGDTPFPEKDFHALIEFGNRVVALGAMLFAGTAALLARRVPGLPPWIRRGWAVVALAIFAQIPLGGLTVVFDLHPLLVMSHFLLALAAVGLAVVATVGAHQHDRGAPSRTLPVGLARLGLALVPVAAILIVTGAFATAAGPHSGGADIERLGNLLDAVYVHVRATAVFGIGFLLLLVALLRRRVEVPFAIGILGVLGLQMAVGEIQWRNQLPWWLVLLHVALATTVWAGIVALAARLRSRSARRLS